MSTIYIAGPMTKVVDFNHPEFTRWAARLRRAGYAVINPAETFGGDVTGPRPVYMRHAVHSLLQADGVFLLQGWRDSEGAVLEWQIAKELGVPILQEHDVQHGLRRAALPEIWRAAWESKPRQERSA